MLEVIVAVLSVATDWVLLVHADDLLVNDGGCDGESDDTNQISGVVSRLEKSTFWMIMTDSCFPRFN